MKAQKELAEGDNAVVAVPGSILNSPGSKNKAAAEGAGAATGTTRKNVAFTDIDHSTLIEIVADDEHGLGERQVLGGSVDDEGQVGAKHSGKGEQMNGRNQGEKDTNGMISLAMDMRDDDVDGGHEIAGELDEDGGQATQHRRGRGVLSWVRKVAGK